MNKSRSALMQLWLSSMTYLMSFLGKYLDRRRLLLTISPPVLDLTVVQVIPFLLSASKNFLTKAPKSALPLIPTRLHSITVRKST